MPRLRRTREEMRQLDCGLIALVRKLGPATVRQLFYLATTLGIIRKTESGYRRVVQRLSHLRLCGTIPWHQIADRTRRLSKPLTFTGVDAALEHTRETYRRAVWHGLEDRLFVVLEKDALLGVVGDVTAEYDVPLLVTRGFSSLTFTHTLAEYISKYHESGHLSFVYALGDWDPSGTLAHDNIKDRLSQWCPKNSCVFHRLAVTPPQISRWDLPSRPTKTSSHATHWEGGESVELDAIPPETLRELVRSAIEHHVPDGYLDALEAAEESERDILRRLTHRVETEDE